MERHGSLFVDLNPAGYTQSAANGASGTTQVGYGYNGNGQHALLWSGTAASAVDLNPAGYTYSLAYGASGTTQVGYSSGTATGNNSHAFLWNGTAASFVDLNPAGYTSSIANGASGTTQVGYGYGTATGNNTHALLWNGTAASAVDLDPAGYTYSLAQGVSGTMQVGYGGGTATGNNYHALLWSGTAASFVDLNAFLPTGFNTQSQAYGIDSNGNIVGYGQGASGTTCLPVAHCRRPRAVAVRRASPSVCSVSAHWHSKPNDARPKHHALPQSIARLPTVSLWQGGRFSSGPPRQLRHSLGTTSAQRRHSLGTTSAQQPPIYSQNHPDEPVPTLR